MLVKLSKHIPTPFMHLPESHNQFVANHRYVCSVLLTGGKYQVIGDSEMFKEAALLICETRGLYSTYLDKIVTRLALNNITYWNNGVGGSLQRRGTGIAMQRY